MSIALNMIIGPFVEPFFVAAVKSALPIISEIVLVDTSPDTQPNRNNIDEIIWAANEKGISLQYIAMPRKDDASFSFAAAREAARINTHAEWILRLDADEVLHEKDYEMLVAPTKLPNISAIEVTFYHFMVYPWLFQYIEPKVILFKRDMAKWVKGVHEVLDIRGQTYRLHEVKYFHYGYCRGEAEVFKRWVLYTDIDGRPNYYDGVDPNTILQDRISVCQNFPKELHPVAVHSTLDRLFPLWREEP